MQIDSVLTRTLVLVSFLFVLFLSGSLMGDGEVTMKGQVLDLACFLGGKSGTSHSACANSCIQSGGAAGFQSINGEVYLLMGKELVSKLENMAGIPVKGKGTGKEREGFKAFNMISVKKVDH